MGPTYGFVFPLMGLGSPLAPMGSHLWVALTLLLAGLPVVIGMNEVPYKGLDGLITPIMEQAIEQDGPRDGDLQNQTP